jgi:hypothetical protein
MKKGEKGTEPSKSFLVNANHTPFSRTPFSRTPSHLFLSFNPHFLPQTPITILSSPSCLLR